VEVAQTQGWNLEWHFADEKVANYMRGKFAEKGYPIKVFHTPPTPDMTEQFGRVLEGSSNELRYLLGLPSW
jgi:Icc-related predicted phosphoesterase